MLLFTLDDKKYLVITKGTAPFCDHKIILDQKLIVYCLLSLLECERKPFKCERVLNVEI